MLMSDEVDRYQIYVSSFSKYERFYESADSR